MAKRSVDELIRNTLLLGIGVSAITMDKANSLVKQLKKDYRLNEKDGRKVAEQTIVQSRKLAARVRKEVEKHVKYATSELSAATKKSMRKSKGKKGKGK